MMLTDTHRIARIACALGPDALVLHRMRGREELGRLLSLALELPAGGEREFNGIVAAFELARPASTKPNRPALYRATVRPRLWLLTRASHCRFFYQKTVPGIIGEVLSGYHIDFENKCAAQ
ncbi:contractile injection system protein, VgrG/Pvc8 family, partial [Caballeronia terrestris]|uniref:contractile injection system protein, VgrG/Pvc8 family n=1 Tax=Caballeronia terrestris TaxID=1226301 RepID=UPI000AB4A1CA